MAARITRGVVLADDAKADDAQEMARRVSVGGHAESGAIWR